MKFVSFLNQGNPSYGVLRDNGGIADLGARHDGAPAEDLLGAIERMGLAGLQEAASRTDADIAVAETTLLPPIVSPRKIICVGLNYRAHAEEGNFKIPTHPSVFLRLADTLTGHDAPLVLPRASHQLDFEGELAIIIGKAGRAIDRDRALEHVFGYACFNDGSLRDIQFGHSTTAGKNFPSTAGFGPCIASADSIPDPSTLQLTTRLNGVQVQHQHTDDMLFDVPAIIAYLSTWTRLLPGDVIATGTPAGVGYVRRPPLWMKEGDVVEVEIPGIGVLRNRIEAEPKPEIS